MIPGAKRRKLDRPSRAVAKYVVYPTRTVLSSTVLKVAHHGTKSSSSGEFLARVAPSAALLTGEGGNLGNLPAAETLERLRVAGARVLRTDLQGAVTAEMQGSRLAVRSYGGPGD